MMLTAHRHGVSSEGQRLPQIRLMGSGIAKAVTLLVYAWGYSSEGTTPA
jgi:hypothetical protein